MLPLPMTVLMPSGPKTVFIGPLPMTVETPLGPKTVLPTLVYIPSWPFVPLTQAVLPLLNTLPEPFGPLNVPNPLRFSLDPNIEPSSSQLFALIIVRIPAFADNKAAHPKRRNGGPVTRTSTQRYESGAEPDRPDQRVTREGRAERRERERRRERLEREGMWQVVSSCAKKRRYVTYDQARAVVRHREREGGEPLFIYRCEHCGGWHITHQADQQRYGREAGRAAEERLARQGAQQAVGPAPRFAVDDLVIDVASGMPCVVVAVGEQGGEPAYELSSADGASELGWVRESDVSEA